MGRLEAELRYRILHRLPNFERHYELGAPFVLSFRDVDCRGWHQEFSERIISAAGCGRYLPVFRVSHGEFIMAVGRQKPQDPTLQERFRFIFHEARRKVGLVPRFRSGSADNSYETFAEHEMGHARAVYLESLVAIARDGLLAAALHLTRGFVEYIPKYLRWLELNGVLLHQANYMPFYSVYALLCGPEHTPLLKGRRVLVITSFSPGKQKAVEERLASIGAASIQCYPVSPTKAMFETVDLSKVKGPVDVVLVGAGVGAARILAQMRPLGAVTIDAGFGIDALAFPEKRWRRPFCVPDAEFEEESVEFVGRQEIHMLKRMNAEQGRTSPSLERIEAMLSARRKARGRERR